jgi:hypothetical protein
MKKPECGLRWWKFIYSPMLSSGFLYHKKNNWFFLFLFTRGKKGKKQEKKLQFL